MVFHIYEFALLLLSLTLLLISLFSVSLFNFRCTLPLLFVPICYLIVKVCRNQQVHNGRHWCNAIPDTTGYYNYRWQRTKYCDDLVTKLLNDLELACSRREFSAMFVNHGSQIIMTVLYVSKLHLRDERTNERTDKETRTRTNNVHHDRRRHALSTSLRLVDPLQMTTSLCPFVRLSDGV